MTGDLSIFVILVVELDWPDVNIFCVSLLARTTAAMAVCNSLCMFQFTKSTGKVGMAILSPELIPPEVATHCGTELRGECCVGDCASRHPELWLPVDDIHIVLIDFLIFCNLLDQSLP